MSEAKVDLEAYETISMWKSDLARTARKGILSKATWKAYKSHMRRFLRSLGWIITPDELIEEAREDVDAAVRRITDFKAHLLDNGVKMNNAITIANGGIQSFYSHNRINLPKITYRKETPRVVESDDNHSLHVYDNATKKIRFNSDVLQDIAANLSFRDQVAMLGILSTSQDPKDLFGLNVGFVRGKNGERLFWASQRQKTGERFRTFFSVEASRFLRKYVETERSNADNEDPLFVTDGRTFERTNPATKEPETISFGVRMNVHAFSMNLRTAQKKLGLVEDKKQAPFRSKRLRKLFRTACARAGIDEGYRMLFMGHSGNVSSGYLETPTAMLEEEYARLEPFVTVFKTTTSEDIDEMTLELKNTKEGLDEQKDQTLELYKKMDNQNERMEALRLKNEELEKVVEALGSDEYLDSLADKAMERKLGSVIRENKKLVASIEEGIRKGKEQAESILKGAREQKEQAESILKGAREQKELVESIGEAWKLMLPMSEGDLRTSILDILQKLGVETDTEAEKKPE